MPGRTDVQQEFNWLKKEHEDSCGDFFGKDKISFVVLRCADHGRYDYGLFMACGNIPNKSETKSEMPPQYPKQGIY